MKPIGYKNCHIKLVNINQCHGNVYNTYSKYMWNKIV